MKYWLILMLFTQDGKYIDKVETEFEGYGQCAIAAGALATDFVNTGTKIQAWCVTEDHYNGVKQDKDIPWDVVGNDDE
jgi:hypothetical protein